MTFTFRNLFVALTLFGVAACSEFNKKKDETPTNNNKPSTSSSDKTSADSGKGNSTSNEGTKIREDDLAETNKLKMFDGKWKSNCLNLKDSSAIANLDISETEALMKMDLFSDAGCKKKTDSIKQTWALSIGNKSSKVEGAFEVDINDTSEKTSYSIWKISGSELLVGKDPGTKKSKRSTELQKDFKYKRVDK